ncbi:MAG: hypothetical protein HQK78_11765, partial [Desulfobacterales bacterium]|nr:hypothetical protein [Desulfobacterales bacterium]
GWNTDDFLRWMLTGATSEEEMEKRQKSIAYSYGFIGHAASDTFSHTYVNMYAGDVFSLMDEQEVETRHNAVESFIVAHQPPLKDRFGKNIGETYKVISLPQSFLADRFILNDTIAEQYKKGAYGAHLAAIYYYRTGMDKVLKDAEQMEQNQGSKDVDIDIKLSDLASALRFNQIKIKAAQELVKIKMTMLQAKTQLLQTLQGKVNDINNTLKKLESQAINPQICEQKCPPPNCRKIFGFTVCSPFSIGCQFICKKTVEALNKAKEIAVNAALLITAEADKRLAEQSKKTLEAELKLAQQQLDLAKKADAEVLARQYHLQRIKDGLMDIASLMVNKLKLRDGLADWRDDIDKATAAYVEANGDVMKNILSNESPIEPLQDWWSCWGLTFIGVPSKFTGTICSIQHSIDSVMDAISDISKKYSEWTSKTGDLEWFLNPVNKLKTTVKEQLIARRDDIEATLFNVITEVIGPNAVPPAKSLISFGEGFLNPVKTDEALDKLFSVDYSNKKLLLIPDASKRVKAEMGLKSGEQYFNPDKYAVVKNSITLVKLTLLSPNELNRLASDFGITGFTKYGHSLFEETGAPFNILFKAVANIDGNHQWQHMALPYPRRVGTPKDRIYGYPFSTENGGSGFRLWEDPQAREKVFVKIFVGPLNPGLEQPGKFGLSEIIPTNYAFKGCEKVPFPDRTQPNQCNIN